MITLLFALVLQAHAHPGHKAADDAPIGPFTVISQDVAWVDCAESSTKFLSPFQKAVVARKDGIKFSVLLGKGVKLTPGTTINPKLVNEKCDQPYKMTCDGRGRPSAPEYKATQKDVFCAGRYNFIIEYQADVNQMK